MSDAEQTKMFHVQVLEERDSQLAQMVAGTRNHIMSDGALSAKTKTLMAMLGDAMNHRYAGVTALSKAARELGATDEEIMETAEVAYWLGGIHAYNTAAEAFRQ